MSQVAWITKTFTSAAVMVLVEEGRLRLRIPSPDTSRSSGRRPV
jgi:hypothetical protein